MRTLAEIAAGMAGSTGSLWEDIETAEEWDAVRQAAGAGGLDAAERLQEVMALLREQVDADLFHALDTAIGELVRTETEAAFAFGQAVAEQESEAVDVLTWAAEFEQAAKDRGLRIGAQGKQREGATTLEELAWEFGVTPRTARRRLQQARDLKPRKPGL